MEFTFKLGEKIREAWALYKEHFGKMLILTLIMLAIQFASQSLSKQEGNFFLILILIVVNVLVSYVWIRAILSLLNGKGFNPFSKESLPSLAQIWDFVKTNILIILCIVPIIFIFSEIIFVNMFIISLFFIALLPIKILGIFVIIFVIILFSSPFIYIAARLFPAKYLSVEKSQGAIKNIKESWQITKGNGWEITWKIVLIGLFVLLGFVALVVGIIITLPVGMIVMVMLYRELMKFKSSQTGEVIVEKVTLAEVPTAEVKVEEKIEIKPEIA